MGLGKFNIEIKCCSNLIIKTMKFDVNGVAVARHGLILSQDGAMHSRIVFIRVLGLFNAKINYFWLKLLIFTGFLISIFPLQGSVAWAVAL